MSSDDKIVNAVITDNSREKKFSIGFKKATEMEEIFEFAKLNQIRGENLYLEKDGTKICNSIALQHFLEKGETILVADSYEEPKRVLFVNVHYKEVKYMFRMTKPITKALINSKWVPGDGLFYDSKKRAEICDDDTLEYCIEKGYTIIKCGSQEDANNIKLK